MEGHSTRRLTRCSEPMLAEGRMAKSGEITAWGDNANGQITNAPKGDEFSVVVPGGSTQSLAIGTDGKLTLWGRGRVPDLTGALNSQSFYDAALSLALVIAIRSDNRQLEIGGGFAGSGGQIVPTDVPSDLAKTKFDSVAAGGGFWVGVRSSDQLLEQRGPGTSPCPKTTFTQVRARHGYGIGLSTGRDLYKWGIGFPTSVGPLEAAWGPSLDYWESDPKGALETVARPHDAGWRQDTAGDVFLPGPFVDLATGARENQTSGYPHILALRPNGAVVGWGADAFEQCRAPNGVTFRAISAGSGFSVGIDDTGKLHHWGSTSLALGLASLSVLPTGPFATVSAGLGHVAAVGGLPLNRGPFGPKFEP
jgi:hypothetical protein